MTSEPIKVFATLTLTPEGEVPEIIREQGELLTKDAKVLLKMGERRIQIERDRVLIRQGYTIELRPEGETALDYPTPYGVLSMKVRTKKLEISADRRKVKAKYSLFSAGERLHDIEMKLRIETEKE